MNGVEPDGNRYTVTNRLWL